MLSLPKTLLLAALTLTLTPGARANTFAQFCNDDACTENCGISVDVNNPGCLKQIGRRSVKFHGDNAADVSMVASPGETCDCQNYCETDLVSSIVHVFGPFTPDCFVLRDEEAQSFRFVEGGCPADQC